MPSVKAPSKILVSGANGFIAVWILHELLQRGYSVRGTVRSETKGQHLRSLFANYADRLELVEVPDITQAGAFDESVKDVDAILHTASPFHFAADDPNELIVPAVKGTVGILESALKNSGSRLQRVVVLSSCASISNPEDRGHLNESNWNETNIKEIQEQGRNASQPAKYRASKSLAEKSAWNFVKEHQGEISWDLVTLCPPFVFGPTLHEVHSPEALNTSAKDFYNSVVKHSKTPEQLAAFQGSWVDVRDVADAHVRALEKEAAGGNRFIVSSGNFIWQDWFDTVNELKISGISAPEGTPGAGKTFPHLQIYDTTKAKTVLGIQFRDKATTATDTLEDFKQKGWVKA